MPPNKPNINRRDLERDGMVYTERVIAQDGPGEASSSLPSHIELFRQALLDFGGLVSDWSELRFQAEAQTYRARGGVQDNKSLTPPESAYLHDSIPPSLVSADVWQHMERCREIAKQAEGLVTAHAQVHEWQQLLQGIFQEYGDIFPFVGEQQEKNILWDDTKKYAEKCPKPDFTYGHTMNQNIPAALRSIDLVSNFSLEVLGDLRSAGLIPSPCAALHKWLKDKTTTLSRDQLICFPWAVVELHPHQVSLDSGEQYSYSQAANGALAVLRLNEEISKWATGSYDSAPPVVAFTCVGADIKVWLAYSEIKDNMRLGHKMVCIWSSSLCLGWGVIATCAIVKNMLLWASRVWKPTISGYISRIQQNKLSFPPDSHVTENPMLSYSDKPFVFTATSTQPTSPPQPVVKKPPVFGFGSQRPSGREGNDQCPASKPSIFAFGSPQTYIPKGTNQGLASENSSLPKIFANKGDGVIIRDGERGYQTVRHGRKSIIIRLPKANYDKIPETKQNLENSKPRPSHARPMTAEMTKAPTTDNIRENDGSTKESTEALEKLNKQINSLDLNKDLHENNGIRPLGKEERPQASDVIPEGTNRNRQDNHQSEPSQEANLGIPRRKILPIKKYNSAANSGFQDKQGDGTTETDFKITCESDGRALSNSLNNEAKSEYGSLFAGSSEMDAHQGQKSPPEHNEDLQDSPDESELMIGSCPHYGRMVAESLQLLSGDELLKLKAVSKTVLEIQGLELLDVTWSVLELWVAQHVNVPSPCKGLETIVRELNSALEFPDSLITPDQMWASEPGTWKLIDKALQNISKSDEPKLKNILVWAIECMDLLESLELCEILKLGELSCLELKRMDRQIIDFMICPENDPSISPAPTVQAAG
ncbi:hypothetical protein ACJ72_05125 [Emergomyces africanus]|uniref:Uncharacterized protein n=1 Tax=Emergomyces africanus TaxID=1955775 RepID=A0A1B7NUT2_9EURO|nr:hypothetical protein ACJ72_05125 [Emergomyces africanus]